jgi:hypothetical protein
MAHAGSVERQRKMANNNTFAKSLEELQVPTVPTSQTIASRLGATPQQVAMTGTQAQIQSTIADRVAQAPLVDSTQAQQQELARRERLQAPRREATVEEALEMERQEQLSKLGNIGQSIQNTIQSNLAAVGQQELGQQEVEQSTLAQILGLSGAQLDLAKATPNSNYNKITGALETYLATGNPNDLETAFATIDNLKIFGVSSMDAKRLVGLTQETMAKQTGQIVSENVMDQVTMKDIDLQGLGFQQGAPPVAEILGLSGQEFSDLTIEEFADTIEAKQKAEFARVDNLKAELQAAPLGSLRREILMRELRDLGQVGITGVEAEVVETVEDIDLAQNIKVGDDLIKVADFLDDENLSQMVIDWINEDDPSRKDDIISPDQFPELISWVQANQAALAKLSETADDTKEVFDRANAEYKALNVIDDLDIGMTAAIMAKIMPNWNPETAITSTQMESALTKFNSSVVGQLASSGRADREEKRNILNKFNTLEGDMINNVLDLSVDDVRAAHAASEVLEDNQDLAKFFDLSSTQGFVLDRTTQDKIADYDAVISTIARRNREWLSTGGSTLELLKTLTPGDLQALVDSPARYEDLDLYTKKRQALSQARTADDYLSIALEQDVRFSDLLDEFNDAKRWAALGDNEASKRLATLTQLFGSSAPTEATVRAQFGGNLGQALRISARSVIDGNLDKNAIFAPRDTFAKRSTVRGASGLHKANERFISDGILSDVDLQSMLPAMQEAVGTWADTVDGIRVDLGGFSSYADYNDNNNEQEFLTIADRAAASADPSAGGSLVEYENWKEDIASGKIRPDAAAIGRLRDFAVRIEGAIPAAKTDRQRALFEELLKDIQATAATGQRLLDADTRQDADDAERIRRELAALATGAVFLPGVSDAGLQQRVVPRSTAADTSQFVLDDTPTFITR